MTRTEGTELIPGWGPKGTSREPGWFRCDRTAPRRHDRREGPHGHLSCMPRNRRPPANHDDMRAGAGAGARRHAGGARGLPEASRPGRLALREERRARRGGPCAARPGRGGRPGRGVPERAGGLREPDRATGDLACVREAARQRAGAILCRHGMSRDGRTPTGRPERRRCQHLRDRPRPVGLGDAGSQAACLAALSAAESAEVACDGPGARAEGIARAPGPGPPVDAPVRARGVGLASALALAAEVGDFSRFASGRRAASCLGLAPSGGPGAEGRRLGRVPGSGRALVRRLLVEGAWVLARGNPAHRKRGGASVPLAIREHARACSGRLLERRRGLIARGLMPCKANTATAAEMARMLLYIGRDAQEAAALAAEVALVA